MNQLNFERGGPNIGPTLLLIHPMGADIRFWDQCRNIWENQFDCLAMDLPAAGASPDPGGILSPQFVAGQLAELVEDEALEQIIPIGCAVGAMAAVALAALMPTKTAGLVLTNPGLKTTPSAKEALASRVAAVRKDGMKTISSAVIDTTFEGQKKDTAYLAFSKRFATQNPEAYARQIEGMLDADISLELEKVGCPTLVITGGRDQLLPAKIGRKLASTLEFCTYQEYSNAAHFIPCQHTSIFVQDVTDWISTL